MNDQQLGNLALGALGTGSQMWGQQNAAEAISHANLDAINNQKSYLGNINSTYSGQKALGDQSMSDLTGLFGGNGKKADYSNFMNMPGYQFAVQQGTQALQRQASSMGNAYTPNTAAAVGQYVTGTAMQDYNTYVQQLLGGAQLGASANQGIADATYKTGANTSQLMANIGQANAGKYVGQGQSIAGGLGGGFNGSGVASGVGSLLNSGIGYLKNMFGGGGGGGSGMPNTGDANGLNPGGYNYSGGDIYGNQANFDPSVTAGDGGTTSYYGDSNP